ncbi:AraC family transcriptional regulator [bacterium]|nr:AraC family transcriptional regulator [bacterium]
MSLFFIAGIGVAVLIEFLLISKKQQTLSDRILTAWMFLIIVHLFLFNLYYTGDSYRVPFLLGFELPLPMLHGVFLFYYVSFVTGQLPRNRKLLLLHLLPAAVMYGYLLAVFILPLSSDQKIAVYEARGAGFELFNILRLWATTISGVVYVILSAVLLRRHRIAIRDSFSDLDKISLRWLEILTYGMGGIWLLLLLFHNEPLTFSGVVTFIFLIGFFGVRQGNIFSPADMKSAPAAPTEEAEGQTAEEVKAGIESEVQPKKYTKSGLSDEAAEGLHAALIALMEEKNMYQKSDLSINDLASTLEVPPNHLSQVINQREKKNFYDFVNSYRIEAFKRQIAARKNQQFTLLSIAYDCGFSSKSSFNRCFKNETGQTPSQFVASRSHDQD